MVSQCPHQTVRFWIMKVRSFGDWDSELWLTITWFMEISDFWTWGLRNQRNQCYACSWVCVWLSKGKLCENWVPRSAARVCDARKSILSNIDTHGSSFHSSCLYLFTFLLPGLLEFHSILLLDSYTLCIGSLQFSVLVHTENVESICEHTYCCSHFSSSRQDTLVFLELGQPGHRSII